jgi:hypothetical protein
MNIPSLPVTVVLVAARVVSRGLLAIASDHLQRLPSQGSPRDAMRTDAALPGHALWFGMMAWRAVPQRPSAERRSTYDCENSDTMLSRLRQDNRSLFC